MNAGVVDILRGNRDYRKLWIASNLSSLGDFIFETTLVLWIVTDLAEGRSWSALVTSILLACSAIPGFVVGPIAGVMVDRSNPRAIRLRTTWMSAILVSLLAITALPGVRFPLEAHLAVILTVVFAASSVAQFLGPSASVMSRELLSDTELPVAAASSQAMSNVILLVAPATAATLFAALGPIVGLAVNAATFIVAGVLVLAVPPREAWHRTTDVTERQPTFIEDFREGFQVFQSLPLLRLIVSTFSLVMVAGGISSVLGIYFIIDRLGASTRQFGWILSAQGIGMIAGSAIAMWLLRRYDPKRVFAWALLGFGLLLLVYSRVQSLLALTVVIVVLGVAIAISTAPVGAMIMTTVPRHVVGRVMSLLGPAFNGSMLIGMVVGGGTYSLLRGSFDVAMGPIRFTPIDSIFTASAFFVVAAGVLAIARLQGLATGAEPDAAPHISPRTTP